MSRPAAPISPKPAVSAALSDQVDDGGGRCADHRQVRGAGQVRHGGIGVNPLHRLAAQVDRVDDARKAGAHQVRKRPVADLAGFVAGADDGDPLGPEDLVEVANAHRFTFRGCLQARF